MLLRTDELNNLKSDIERYRGDRKKLSDLMDDWLMLAYADGKADVEEQLQGETQRSIERIMDVMYAEIGGKTAFDRIEDDLDSLEDLYLLYENERQRVYNTAAHDTAEDLKAKYKTWHTMGDARVRDSHFYLDGETKQIDEEFHTIWGNSGQHPGAFNAPEDDIGCRCWLTYNK